MLTEPNLDCTESVGHNSNLAEAHGQKLRKELYRLSWTLLCTVKLLLRKTYCVLWRRWKSNKWWETHLKNKGSSGALQYQLVNSVNSGEPDSAMMVQYSSLPAHHMHQPGIELRSVTWQGTILPLDHWWLLVAFFKEKVTYRKIHKLFIGPGISWTIIKSRVLEPNIMTY